MDERDAASARLVASHAQYLRKTVRLLLGSSAIAMAGVPALLIGLPRYGEWFFFLLLLPVLLSSQLIRAHAAAAQEIEVSERQLQSRFVDGALRRLLASIGVGGLVVVLACVMFWRLEYLNPRVALSILVTGALLSLVSVALENGLALIGLADAASGSLPENPHR